MKKTAATLPATDTSCPETVTLLALAEKRNAARNPELRNAVCTLLKDHSGTLLDKLQRRAERTHNPAMQDVGNAHPQDMNINPLSNGGSRLTYKLEVAGYPCILTVFIPRNMKLARADFEDRHQFRRHIRAKGVPIPGKIGEPFTLPGIPFPCELTEYCRGYHPPKDRPLSPTETEALGDLLGRIHGAPPFHAKRMRNTMGEALKDLYLRLPTGFLHGDLSHNNVLFEEGESGAKVAGLIDFELARKGRYATDLADTLIKFTASHEVLPDGTARVIRHPENERRFLAAYSAHRPLTAREEKFLPTLMDKAVRRQEKRLVIEREVEKLYAQEEPASAWEAPGQTANTPDGVISATQPGATMTTRLPATSRALLGHAVAPGQAPDHFPFSAA
jgi:Ser/Thr protein kinase RdoA (MazF antagonist)